MTQVVSRARTGRTVTHVIIQFGNAALRPSVLLPALAALGIIGAADIALLVLFNSHSSVVVPVMMTAWLIFQSVTGDKGARLSPDGAVFRTGRKEKAVPLASITEIRLDDRTFALGPDAVITFHQGRFDEFTWCVPRRQRTGVRRQALEQKMQDARRLVEAARGPSNAASTP